MQGYKTVSASHTTLTELMIPSYSNFGGKIHGGLILSLMDKVAYVCAAKHADGYCITASIDVVNFLEPVEVGELLSLMASVNYVGRSSIVIGIRVISENLKTQIIKHTNTSYITMVAMGEDHKPREVPGLILKTQDDIRRFSQAMKRKKRKMQIAEEENAMRAEFDVASCRSELSGERCLLELPEML